jgi:hypothetical protein
MKFRGHCLEWKEAAREYPDICKSTQHSAIGVPPLVGTMLIYAHNGTSRPLQ